MFCLSLNPARDPLNPQGYTATQRTPFACVLSNSNGGQIQIVHTADTQPAGGGSSTDPDQDHSTSGWRHRIAAVTEEYGTILRRVQSGQALPQALSELQ